MTWTKEGSRRGGLRSAMKTRGKAKNPERDRRIVKAILEGKSLSSVARRFDLTEGMIRYVLKRMGVNRPKRDPGPNFPCGHPRNPNNTLMNAGYARCLDCHRASARRWHNPKNPVKPLYGSSGCVLQETWG